MAKDDTLERQLQNVAPQVAEELKSLRRTASDLGRQLAGIGRTRAGEIGEEIEGLSERVVRDARHALRDMDRRIGRLEKYTERSIREHPAPWVGGVLGIIGLGLVLGMVLRRRD